MAVAGWARPWPEMLPRGRGRGRGRTVVTYTGCMARRWWVDLATILRCASATTATQPRCRNDIATAFKQR